ncbi:MAG: alpha/beta hydrolase, partial [Acidimicrobiia bacterium]|nr:alpha/beta hydrolase [Acidimicrobiia bacterium]
QVITFDNRDIGLSTQCDWTPPSQWRQLLSLITRRRLKRVGHTLTDMAADAAGLLDGLGVGPTHIVGLSMGGMIAQEMAIGHPEKVRSLCSIMSNPGDRRSGGVSARLLARLGRPRTPTRDTAADEFVRVFEQISGPHFDADLVRAQAKLSVERSFTPEGVARQSAAVAGSRDRTEPLGLVTAPVLVIHGLLDPLVKFSGGVATAAAVPASRLIVFPDMGHDLPRSRWHEMRDAIIANTQRAGRSL